MGELFEGCVGSGYDEEIIIEAAFWVKSKFKSHNRHPRDSLVNPRDSQLEF